MIVRNNTARLFHVRVKGLPVIRLVPFTNTLELDAKQAKAFTDDSFIKELISKGAVEIEKPSKKASPQKTSSEIDPLEG